MVLIYAIACMQYPLCTLLVFDSRQHALPVAWIITRSFAKPDTSKWMKALVDRIRAVDTGWKVSGYVIDDAAAELEPIRQATHTVILYICLQKNLYCLLIYCLIRVQGYVLLSCVVFPLACT